MSEKFVAYIWFWGIKRLGMVLAFTTLNREEVRSLSLS
jgi:hypothetical protein